MNKFKKLKKALALVLVFCMVMGSIPATAFAAETKTVVDSAVVISDLHTTSSDNKSSTVTGILQQIENAGKDASTVTSAGDMFSVNETNYNCNTTAITNAINSVYENAEVDYVWSDHDRMASEISKESRLVYGTGEGENYYVYLLSMADLSSWDRYNAGFFSASEITNHIESFKTTAKNLDKTKPLFIVGHQPLFNDRGDNGYAYQWATAINEVAATMDVAYFHGHNHNYDEESNYYYAKGDTMSIPTTKVLSGSGYSTKLEAKDVELKFTHINAGYMSPATGNTSNTRMGTALAVTIYEDSINYTTYDKNGVYTGKFAKNETVERDFAEEASNTVTDLDGMVSVTATSPGLTGITATNVVAEKNLEGYFTDYVAYEVELEGYQEGNEVAYSMYLLEDMDDTNLELYLVADNGEMTPITFKKVTDVQGNKYLEFSVMGDGCFAYGAPKVPEGYELSKLEVSNVVKTEYYQGESLDMVNPVVTATYVKDGYKDFVRKLAIKGEGFEDGYTISGFDMTKLGKQTVTITYGGKTTSFEIDVKEKGVSDSINGVKIVDENNSITDLTVTKKIEKVEGYKTYVVYDIVPEGYVQGTEAEVTIQLDQSFSKNGQVIVFDIEKNTSSVYSVTNRKLTFKTNHFSEYAVAEIAENGTLQAQGMIGARMVQVTSANELVDGEPYVIVSNTAKATLTSSVSRKDNTDKLQLVPGTVMSHIWYYDSLNDNNTNTGGFYIGTNTAKQWLTITHQTAYLTTNSNENARVLNVVEQNDSSLFRLSNNTSTKIYLNKEGSAVQLNQNGHAHGWNAADDNSNWQIYKIVQDPVMLSVTPSEIDLYLVGDEGIDKAQLSPAVTVGGSNASSYTVIYSSENTEVATVSENGLVTAKGVGDTNIVVTLTKANGTDLVSPINVQIPVRVNNVVIEGEKIDIIDPLTQRVIDHTLVVKNVEEGMTYNFDYKLYDDGVLVSPKPTENITWNTSDSTIATVDSNGTVTFHGNEGIVRITVSHKYTDDEGKIVYATDSVSISVSKGNYMLPSDGTNDFPEYPNEGSIRFDKTATAVGNFSETGIAQLELSMTGVPFTSENRMDVVLMLDRSSSMYKEGVKHRISSTVEATKAFVKNVVTNEDGSFNNNRIMVMDFLGGNLASGSQHQYESNLYTTREDNGYQVINNQAELDALFTKIQTDFVGQTSLYGTEYAKGLEDCYKALHGSKEDGNKQFCVFMSDGIPNYMMGENTHFQSTEAITGTFDVTDRTSANGTATRNATKYEYEKYSTQMKNEGVTVFSVGLGLKNTNSAWSYTSAAVCEQVANMLLNDISGPAGEAVADRDTGNSVSKLNEYFFSVADDNAAAQMKDVFTSIAKKIQEAAKNVKVTDKIADEYTMIFDVPDGPDSSFVNSHLPEGQEFYLEVVDYTLKPVVEQGVTVDYERDKDKEKSLMKLYLGKDNSGNFFAASDANGTRFAEPKFEAVRAAEEGQKAPKGYYNLVNGEYVFVADGTGAYNMVSGARVSGTNNDNIIIETPYVHYEAATRMLVWTTEKLSSSELALRYFLYLNKSAAEKPENQVDAGTYPTNDYATLDYTNFQGNECQQIFPKPQMTWNGAQVSYVFYLVNEEGKPVNRAGRVVPFSEAVYVTDVFTHAVTWNKNDASAALEVEYLASDKVPDVYELYDNHAGYNIYVYETENGENKNNHFDIIGETDTDTTYVFNTKSDAVKYKEPGTYNRSSVHTGFDFSNTTVAFAVLWKPELAEDTVVVDYGLPVDIDVARNDGVSGSVSGIFDANNGAVLEDVEINKGQISNRVMFATELSPEPEHPYGIKYGKAEVISNTSVRYTPLDMQMKSADKFYYVTSLSYYEKNNQQQDVLIDSRMYSSVTVIPATTIYYEDTFVSYKHGYGATNDSDKGTPGKWETVGTVNSKATQDEDRPGESQISADLDADNIYGYDKAYADCDTYSLGSARKVNLNKKPSGTEWPKATFTFTGTAFDVISQTSNTTGTIAVEVKNEAGNVLHNWIVDTYYGYTAEKNGFKENTFKYGDDGKWHLTKSEVSENKGENGTKPAEPKVGDTVVVYEDNIVWTPEKPYLKNTYAYEDGEWKLTTEEVEEKVLADDESLAKPDTPQNGDKYVEFENNDNTLYQIPVIKSPEMAYGTYTVTITPRFSAGFNHTANDNYDFYLDAIRVYSPADDGVVENANGSIDTTVNDAYKADGELYPEFIELRKELLEQGAFDTDDDPVTGAVFIDGLTTDGTISDYSKYGPNNEIYLQKGQAVAFVLESNNPSSVNKAHLGIKSPNGGDAEVTVSSLTANGTAKASTKVATSSATELYFDVSKCVSWNTNGNSDIVVISNTSKENAMVSLTNLKITYDVQNAEPTVLTMNAEGAAMASRFVSAEYVNSVKTAKEAKVVSVAADKATYVPGETVKVTVKTNDAAEYVKVNGKKITSFKKSGSLRIWTYTEKASKTGTVTFKAVAYNSLDEASKEASKNVTVKNFAPKTLKLALSKSTVVKKDTFKATVTTSEDVNFVNVNGYKVKTYKSDKTKKTRTWTISLKANVLGKRTIKAVAYDKYGNASKTVSKTLTVKKFVPKTFKLALSNSSVKKGTKYVVTVTTSKDVKYVTLNGKKITGFTTDKKSGLRTFKEKYSATSVGKKTVKAVAYNTNGSESSAKTKTVTVKRK